MQNRINRTILFAIFLTVLILPGYLNTVNAGTYPPGISFSTLLNGVKYFPKTGEIRLSNIHGVFFPGPDSQGHVNIVNEKGEELYRLDYRVRQLKSPYYFIDFHKATDLKTGKQLPSLVETKIPGQGKYRVDFFIENVKFHTFPFELTGVGSSDPFAAEGTTLLQGDWSDWGYLFYQDANTDRNLEWKIWLRSGTAERQKNAKINVEILKAGKMIARSYDRATHDLHNYWTRYAFGMYHPSGTLFKAKELLAKDGDYSLKMTIDGKLYGVWNFKVEKGKLNYTGRTLRGTADPMTFIEGGRDAFWYKKQ